MPTHVRWRHVPSSSAVLLSWERPEAEGGEALSGFSVELQACGAASDGDEVRFKEGRGVDPRVAIYPPPHVSWIFYCMILFMWRKNKSR